MSGRAHWLLPLAVAPLLVVGLWLWRDQGAFLWVSGFVASCF